MVWIIVYIPVLFFIYHLMKYLKHIYDLQYYPPGPFPLPFVGNINLLRNSPPHLMSQNLSKKYGSVFSLSCGTQRAVFVNDIESTREALVKKGTKFAGRNVSSNNVLGYELARFQSLAGADYGPYWTLAQKLTHSALKIYGDGLGKLEGLIVRQYDALRNRLDAKIDNGALDLPEEIGLTVLNVICGKVFSEEYNMNDLEFKKMVEFSELISEGFSSRDRFLLNMMPWLKIFPLKALKQIRRARELRNSIIIQKLTEHEATFDPDNLRDFTDSLIKAKKEEEKGGSRLDFMKTEHLMAQMAVIFFAGFETTWKTLHWTVLHLLHWPVYQELMFQEMVDVLDGERYPSLKDRQSLPMCQAVMHETLRFACIAPFTLPHKAVETDSIDGKPIPKGTIINFCIWSMHHDEKYWENPGSYNPYRWLDENGKYSPGKNKSFMPFSAGRRVCIGESIAKAEIFLLLTRLVRDYKISPNLDEPFPSLKANLGLVLNPNDFKVILSPRDYCS